MAANDGALPAAQALQPQRPVAAASVARTVHTAAHRRRSYASQASMEGEASRLLAPTLAFRMKQRERLDSELGAGGGELSVETRAAAAGHPHTWTRSYRASNTSANALGAVGAAGAGATSGVHDAEVATTVQEQLQVQAQHTAAARLLQRKFRGIKARRAFREFHYYCWLDDNWNLARLFCTYANSDAAVALEATAAAEEGGPLPPAVATALSAEQVIDDRGPLWEGKWGQLRGTPPSFEYHSRQQLHHLVLIHDYARSRMTLPSAHQRVAYDMKEVTDNLKQRIRKAAEEAVLVAAAKAGSAGGYSLAVNDANRLDAKIDRCVRLMAEIMTEWHMGFGAWLQFMYDCRIMMEHRPLATFANAFRAAHVAEQRFLAQFSMFNAESGRINYRAHHMEAGGLATGSSTSDAPGTAGAAGHHAADAHVPGAAQPPVWALRVGMVGFLLAIRELATRYVALEYGVHIPSGQAIGAMSDPNAGSEATTGGARSKKSASAARTPQAILPMLQLAVAALGGTAAAGLLCDTTSGVLIPLRARLAKRKLQQQQAIRSPTAAAAAAATARGGPTVTTPTNRKPGGLASDEITESEALALFLSDCVWKHAQRRYLLRGGSAAWLQLQFLYAYTADDERVAVAMMSMRTRMFVVGTAPESVTGRNTAAAAAAASGASRYESSSDGTAATSRAASSTATAASTSKMSPRAPGSDESEPSAGSARRAGSNRLPALQVPTQPGGALTAAGPPAVSPRLQPSTQAGSVLSSPMSMNRRKAADSSTTLQSAVLAEHEFYQALSALCFHGRKSRELRFASLAESDPLTDPFFVPPGVPVCVFGPRRVVAPHALSLMARPGSGGRSGRFVNAGSSPSPPPYRRSASSFAMYAAMARLGSSPRPAVPSIGSVTEASSVLPAARAASVSPTRNSARLASASSDEALMFHCAGLAPGDLSHWLLSDDHAMGLVLNAEHHFAAIFQRFGVSASSIDSPYANISAWYHREAFKRAEMKTLLTKMTSNLFQGNAPIAGRLPTSTTRPTSRLTSPTSPRLSLATTPQGTPSSPRAGGFGGFGSGDAGAETTPWRTSSDADAAAGDKAADAPSDDDGASVVSLEPIWETSVFGGEGGGGLTRDTHLQRMLYTDFLRAMIQAGMVPPHAQAQPRTYVLLLRAFLACAHVPDVDAHQVGLVLDGVASALREQYYSRLEQARAAVQAASQQVSALSDKLLSMMKVGQSMAAMGMMQKRQVVVHSGPGFAVFQGSSAHMRAGGAAAASQASASPAPASASAMSEAGAGERGAIAAESAPPPAAPPPAPLPAPSPAAAGGLTSPTRAARANMILAKKLAGGAPKSVRRKKPKFFADAADGAGTDAAAGAADAADEAEAATTAREAARSTQSTAPALVAGTSAAGRSEAHASASHVSAASQAEQQPAAGTEQRSAATAGGEQDVHAHRELGAYMSRRRASIDELPAVAQADFQSMRFRRLLYAATGRQAIGGSRVAGVAGAAVDAAEASLGITPHVVNVVSDGGEEAAAAAASASAPPPPPQDGWLWGTPARNPITNMEQASKLLEILGAELSRIQNLFYRMQTGVTSPSEAFDLLREPLRAASELLGEAAAARRLVQTSPLSEPVPRLVHMHTSTLPIVQLQEGTSGNSAVTATRSGAAGSTTSAVGAAAASRFGTRRASAVLGYEWHIRAAHVLQDIVHDESVECIFPAMRTAAREAFDRVTLVHGAEVKCRLQRAALTNEALDHDDITGAGQIACDTIFLGAYVAEENLARVARTAPMTPGASALNRGGGGGYGIPGAALALRADAADDALSLSTAGDARPSTAASYASAPGEEGFEFGARGGRDGRLPRVVSCISPAMLASAILPSSAADQLTFADTHISVTDILPILARCGLAASDTELRFVLSDVGVDLDEYADDLFLRDADDSILVSALSRFRGEDGTFSVYDLAASVPVGGVGGQKMSATAAALAIAPEDRSTSAAPTATAAGSAIPAWGASSASAAPAFDVRFKTGREAREQEIADAQQRRYVLQLAQKCQRTLRRYQSRLLISFDMLLAIMARLRQLRFRLLTSTMSEGQFSMCAGLLGCLGLVDLRTNALQLSLRARLCAAFTRVRTLVRSMDLLTHYKHVMPAPPDRDLPFWEKAFSGLLQRIFLSYALVANPACDVPDTEEEASTQLLDRRVLPVPACISFVNECRLFKRFLHVSSKKAQADAAMAAGTPKPQVDVAQNAETEPASGSTSPAPARAAEAGGGGVDAPVAAQGTASPRAEQELSKQAFAIQMRVVRAKRIIGVIRDTVLGRDSTLPDEDVLQSDLSFRQFRAVILSLMTAEYGASGFPPDAYLHPRGDMPRTMHPGALLLPHAPADTTSLYHKAVSTGLNVAFSKQVSSSPGAAATDGDEGEGGSPRTPSVHEPAAPSAAIPESALLHTSKWRQWQHKQEAKWMTLTSEEVLCAPPEEQKRFCLARADDIVQSQHLTLTNMPLYWQAWAHEGRALIPEAASSGSVDLSIMRKGVCSPLLWSILVSLHPHEFSDPAWDCSKHRPRDAVREVSDAWLRSRLADDMFTMVTQLARRHTAWTDVVSMNPRPRQDVVVAARMAPAPPPPPTGGPQRGEPGGPGRGAAWYNRLSRPEQQRAGGAAAAAAAGSGGRAGKPPPRRSVFSFTTAPAMLDSAVVSAAAIRHSERRRSVAMEAAVGGDASEQHMLNQLPARLGDGISPYGALLRTITVRLWIIFVQYGFSRLQRLAGRVVNSEMQSLLTRGCVIVNTDVAQQTDLLDKQGARSMPDTLWVTPLNSEEVVQMHDIPAVPPAFAVDRLLRAPLPSLHAHAPMMVLRGPFNLLRGFTDTSNYKLSLASTMPDVGTASATLARVATATPSSSSTSAPATGLRAHLPQQAQVQQPSPHFLDAATVEVMRLVWYLHRHRAPPLPSMSTYDGDDARLRALDACRLSAVLCVRPATFEEITDLSRMSLAALPGAPAALPGARARRGSVAAFPSAVVARTRRLSITMLLGKEVPDDQVASGGLSARNRQLVTEAQAGRRLPLDEATRQSTLAALRVATDFAVTDADLELAMHLMDRSWMWQLAREVNVITVGEELRQEEELAAATAQAEAAVGMMEMQADSSEDEVLEARVASKRAASVAAALTRARSAGRRGRSGGAPSPKQRAASPSGRAPARRRATFAVGDDADSGGSDAENSDTELSALHPRPKRGARDGGKAGGSRRRSAAAVVDVNTANALVGAGATALEYEMRLQHMVESSTGEAALAATRRMAHSTVLTQQDVLLDYLAKVADTQPRDAGGGAASSRHRSGSISASAAAMEATSQMLQPFLAQLRLADGRLPLYVEHMVAYLRAACVRTHTTAAPGAAPPLGSSRAVGGAASAPGRAMELLHIPGVGAVPWAELQEARSAGFFALWMRSCHVMQEDAYDGAAFAQRHEFEAPRLRDLHARLRTLRDTARVADSTPQFTAILLHSALYALVMTELRFSARTATGALARARAPRLQPAAPPARGGGGGGGSPSLLRAGSGFSPRADAKETRAAAGEPTVPRAPRASRPLPPARSSVASIPRPQPPAPLSSSAGGALAGGEDASGRFAQLLRGVDALMQASAAEFMLHAADPALAQVPVPLAGTLPLTANSDSGGSAAAGGMVKAAPAAAARPAAPMASVYSFSTVASDTSAAAIAAAAAAAEAAAAGTSGVPLGAPEPRRASLQPRVPVLSGMPSAAADELPTGAALSTGAASKHAADAAAAPPAAHTSARSVMASPPRSVRRAEADIILTTATHPLSGSAGAGVPSTFAAMHASGVQAGGVHRDRGGGAPLLSPTPAHVPRSNGAAAGVRSPMGALTTASAPNKPLTAYYDELARRFAGNSFVQDTMRTLKQHAANSSGNALETVQDISARAEWPFDALLSGFPPANKRTSVAARSPRKSASGSLSPARRSARLGDAATRASGAGGRDSVLTTSSPSPTPTSPTSCTPVARAGSSAAAKRLNSRLSVRVTFGGDVLEAAAAALKEDDVRAAAPTAPPLLNGRSSGGSGSIV